MYFMGYSITHEMHCRKRYCVVIEDDLKINVMFRQLFSDKSTKDLVELVEQ